MRQIAIALLACVLASPLLAKGGGHAGAHIGHAAHATAHTGAHFGAITRTPRLTFKRVKTVAAPKPKPFGAIRPRHAVTRPPLATIGVDNV
jgi:hypothetical protein